MTTSQELTIWRALNAALHDAFSEDPSVFIMGEDITTWGTGGGIYGVTRKLATAFGPERVRDTPISEEALISAAAGAALTGQRPIIEIMYSDFVLLGSDGLVNQAAKARYMFGGQFEVPMVLRTNGGSSIGKAAQHSQSLETIWAHIPGLEVVVPATADDAYGLLRTAIRSDNPTLFLEHKALYFERGPVSRIEIPLGQARIGRSGDDVTVVATQLEYHRAMKAAEQLAEEGISVEVIDPRTLYPLDLDTIYKSVRKTRHLVVVHEAVRDYGWGGEIVSDVVGSCWDSLDAAPVRLGAARVPIPYAQQLEDAVIPDVDAIRNAVRTVVRTVAHAGS